MANPDFVKYKDMYSINELSFKTKTDLINSQYIQEIVPPYPSFLDRRNKNGAANYSRFLNGGNFISNAQICLMNVLGLINKNNDEVKLPSNMEDIIYYATIQNTSIQSIKNLLVESIFKFGSGLLKVVIPENVSIADSIPKFEVIPGNKVVDYSTVLDENGNEKFEFIVIDTSRYILNKITKYYSWTKIYKILSINSDGNYYECEIPQNVYGQFIFDNPMLAREKHISYVEPAWTNNLDFIPVVGINKLDSTFKYTQAFIQDLIETSLTNFRLSCTLAWLVNNCAASHLVIKGKNLDDITNYPVGAGALHILNDETADEEYLTPSTNGMDEVKKIINDNNLLMDQMQYSLLNAGANSAAEALQFRISVKVADLVALVKNIGNCLTRGLEMIDLIMNNGANKDLIEFIPYTDFSQISEYIGDTTENNEEEKED